MVGEVDMLTMAARYELRAWHSKHTAPHLTPHHKPDPTAQIVAMFAKKHAWLWHEVEAIGDKHAVRKALKALVDAGMLKREGQYYRSLKVHAAELREGLLAITTELTKKGYVKGYRATHTWIAEDVPAFKKAEVVS